MKKVLLLGGAGFIGFNITKFLSFNRKYDVTVADNFFRGKMDDVFSEHIQRFNIKVVNADFTDMKSFSLLENDYDYVYFLAAVVVVKYTQEIPNELIRINTFLTINTLEWLKESKCKKVLFTSTSECYAGTIESFGYTVPTDEEVPLSINDITNPRFTYAVTKMLGESGFYHYSRIFGFECTIVRYHNVYGPRMGFKHVIDDAVNGTVLAMEKDNTNGQIFHIGDMRDEIKIETLVRFIGETMGYNGLYEYVPAPDGSVSRRCPDISKATRILGYEPLTTWQVGVKNTVTWYKEYIEAGGNIFE